ncbi:hypothetical protein T12_14266 [Trichinella patagoniensis]|uniref:Uncharacterized protein n=1 Tax=Trichinella patagoniensis TaxID=990121 RepID=A0A0V0YYB6_9BILA|nr:hypothetical protein T12_14266 [Trichinella patagoniensis]
MSVTGILQSHNRTPKCFLMFKSLLYKLSEWQ